METQSIIGEQVLWRLPHEARVGYIEVEDRDTFQVNFSGQVYMRVDRKKCILLPHLYRPYTIVEAIQWWLYRKEAH